ncbi:hypothetical protein [Microvirga aerophila]|uniref:Uncharacterized protein n=1 Tax=Microvirga aerophila TaxID=670291 RepID=A0A512BKV2_9HYPH|nr:hypothetical protein [Microvirga aerophila]GEO12602.1 hypothetical protein MAE02_02980 [Microvirga aerophila]
MEGEIPALNAAVTCHNGELLQLGKVHALDKRLVEVITVLFKTLDQPFEELSTLLIPQPEDVLESVYYSIDAAQAIKVALPVSALAPGHQLLFGIGEGGRVGGEDPISLNISYTEPERDLTARVRRTWDAEILTLNRGRAERPWPIW